VEPCDPLSVSARASSELLHAEVGHLLGRAGIPVLHIKGPTVTLWLYEPGERSWGDVDVLVAPADMDEAMSVLAEHGLTGIFPGVTRSSTTDHAIAVGRRELTGIVTEVDVHDRFPGVSGDPERVFAELWRRREPATLAHTEVWFPDLPTRALFVALNTARSQNPQAMGDLARLISAAQPRDWQNVIALARRVDALPALRAGLELDPQGRAVVATTALAAIEVTSEWRLRLAGAPRTALRLEELGRLPWSQRVTSVCRWLVPPPAIVRMRDPMAAEGAVSLVLAYVRRLRDGVRAVPPSLRALAGQRREARRVADAGRARMQDFSS